LTGTGYNSFTVSVSASILPITVTSPGTQSSTAGVSHNFALGSFSDPNGGATTWTETINWGDSSSSTLNLPPGSLGDLAHTYATAATYTVTVTVTDNLTGTGFNTFTANVSPSILPITVTSPGTQSSTAGVSHNFALGSFTDPNGGATTWTETINWGDSSSSTLNLPPGSLGDLAHTYATAAAYTVTVSVTDNLTGTGSTTFTANVSSSVLPIAVTSPGTQASVADSSHAFALGSFTDPNAASSWTESVNWGDSSSNTLHLPPGSLGTLDHTYASSAAYAVTVTVTDNLTGVGSNSFTANVSPSVLPITVTAPPSQASTAGVSQAFALGSFSDPNPASSWIETINWGDSSTSTLNLPPGLLGTLNHTYATAGSFPVTVTVTDNLTGIGSNAFSVNVSAGITLSAVAFSKPAKSTARIQVASFTDSNTALAAGDYSVTILWSNGATTTGTISGSGGNFKVTSKHAYARATKKHKAIALVTVWETGTPSTRLYVLTTGTITPGRPASAWAEVFDKALSQVTVKKNRRNV
jgi:PKD repeat protein